MSATAEPIFYWCQGSTRHGPFSTMDEALVSIRALAQPKPSVRLDSISMAPGFKSGVYDPAKGPPEAPAGFENAVKVSFDPKTGMWKDERRARETQR